MAVKRIVPNIPTPDPSAAQASYGNVLGLQLVMDQGWILTFAAADMMAAPQISIAREGGAGTVVPDLTIEVDDFEDVLHRVCAASFPVEYGPADEPWGVRRLYVRDPFGRLINVMTHRGSTTAGGNAAAGSDHRRT